MSQDVDKKEEPKEHSEEMFLKEIELADMPPQTNQKKKSTAMADRDSPERLLQFFKTPSKEWGVEVDHSSVIFLCECGARHTSFPGIHLQYCPLFVP